LKIYDSIIREQDATKLPEFNEFLIDNLWKIRYKYEIAITRAVINPLFIYFDSIQLKRVVFFLKKTHLCINCEK
jgi:hypothetical protein